jgi:hypothetical protein
MKNNDIIFSELNSSLFNSEITYYLSNNIGKHLIMLLSNLLTIDYENRLKGEPEIKEYSHLCVTRLKKHLGHQVILDEKFSSAMTLFTIAITAQQDSGGDEELINQTREAVAESIISSHYPEILPEEQEIIRTVLKYLLNTKDKKQIMDIINADPDLFYACTISAIGSSTTLNEINESVFRNLKNIADDSMMLERKTSQIKNFFAKAALATGILALGSTALVAGAVAVFIVPAAIVVGKYAPLAGKKMGNIIANNMSGMKQEKEELQEKKDIIKSKAITGKTKAMIKVQSYQKDVSKEKNIDVTKNIKTPYVSHTQKNLKQKISNQGRN